MRRGDPLPPKGPAPRRLKEPPRSPAAAVSRRRPQRARHCGRRSRCARVYALRLCRLAGRQGRAPRAPAASRRARVSRPPTRRPLPVGAVSLSRPSRDPLLPCPDKIGSRDPGRLPVSRSPTPPASSRRAPLPLSPRHSPAAHPLPAPRKARGWPLQAHAGRRTRPSPAMALALAGSRACHGPLRCGAPRRDKTKPRSRAQSDAAAPAPRSISNLDRRSAALRAASGGRAVPREPGRAGPERSERGSQRGPEPGTRARAEGPGLGACWAGAARWQPD